MDIRMEHKEGFQMAGLTMASHPDADFTQPWKDLFSKFKELWVPVEKA